MPEAAPATASGSKVVVMAWFRGLEVSQLRGLAVFDFYGATSKPRDRATASIHIHRIPDRRIVLFRSLHRFLEALVEDAGAVFLAGHLAVELLLLLALLRFETGHHRLQRAAGAPLLRLVQQNLAGGAVDDESGIAAGTGDLEVGGHSGAILQRGARTS